jgi:hypothetical protein
MTMNSKDLQRRAADWLRRAGDWGKIHAALALYEGGEARQIIADQQDYIAELEAKVDRLMSKGERP